MIIIEGVGKSRKKGKKSGTLKFKCLLCDEHWRKCFAYAISLILRAPLPSRCYYNIGDMRKLSLLEINVSEVQSQYAILQVYITPRPTFLLPKRISIHLYIQQMFIKVPSVPGIKNITVSSNPFPALLELVFSLGMWWF